MYEVQKRSTHGLHNRITPGRFLFASSLPPSKQSQQHKSVQTIHIGNQLSQSRSSRQPLPAKPFSIACALHLPADSGSGTSRSTPLSLDFAPFGTYSAATPGSDSTPLPAKLALRLAGASPPLACLLAACLHAFSILLCCSFLWGIPFFACASCFPGESTYTDQSRVPCRRLRASKHLLQFRYQKETWLLWRLLLVISPRPP